MKKKHWLIIALIAVLAAEIGYLGYCIVQYFREIAWEDSVEAERQNEKDDEDEDEDNRGEDEDDGREDTTEETEMPEDTSVRLSILGDSLSTFEGWIPEGYSVFFPRSGMITDVSQTWWMQYMEAEDLTLCVNGSSSGCTAAGDSRNADDPKNGCSDSRIAALKAADGAMPDIIIVFMGTNDLLNDVPLGDNDGTREVQEGVIDNFSDAYCLILDKLQKSYPDAQICCCTLAPVGAWGDGSDGNPFVTLTNSFGLTAEDYSQQIRVIAGSKNATVVDLMDCGITLDNLIEMVSDGVHFTPAGMECVARAMEEQIEIKRD